MAQTCLVWLINKIDKVCKATQENRLIMAQNSVKNVTTYMKLPVIIFHEDFTHEVKEEFINIYDNITFCKIDFQNNDLPYNKNVSKCGKGYMMMCRFFSGVMQSMDIFKEYDSYIRMDDDSFLIEPIIDTDKFLLEAKKYYYVNRTIFFDNSENIKQENGLFNFTYKFCKANYLDIDNLMPALKVLGFLKDQNYTGMSPYNNFHYSKLNLWKNTVIKNYTDKIINMNGTLLYNWMDANIHGMIIYVLCPLLHIPTNEITEFGYRHNKHFSILNSNKYTFKQNEDFYPKII